MLDPDQTNTDSKHCLSLSVSVCLAVCLSVSVPLPTPSLSLSLSHLDHEADKVVNGEAAEDLVTPEPVELVELLQPLQLSTQVRPRVDDRLHIAVSAVHTSIRTLL